MRAPTLAIALCAAGAQAFVGVPVVQQPITSAATTRGRSSVQPLSMAGSGIASTRAGKTKVVEEVSEMLSTASLVFALPSSGIKANQVVQLRKELPEGCTARVVKNKLMRIACKGSQFEGLSEITTGENFWMFVDGEENLAEPIKLITKFAKANMDKENVNWQKPFKGGVFGGEVLDGPGVVAISKLPTKQELMQRLAIALNSVPTKLGRSINLVPTKVGRAVKLAFAPEGDGEGAASDSDEASTEAAADAPAATEEGEAAAPVAEEAAAPPAEEAPAAE